MKATLTYKCDEPGHEQTMTITASGDFGAATTTMHVTMDFEPPCSDDTSDPTGLLSAALTTWQNWATKTTRRTP